MQKFLTAEAAFSLPSPVPPLPRGGTWTTRRTFDPSAIQIPAQTASVAEPVAPPTPEQEAAAEEITRIIMASPDPAADAGRAVELFAQRDAARDCNALNGTCEQHEYDDGAIIHRGALLTASGPFGVHLLEHQLVQWGDDAPAVEFAGDGHSPELDLPGVNALIAAVEQQLAHLREARNHLAAALGQPPAEPPEQQDAPAPPVFRASHHESGITLGYYTSREAAMDHVHGTLAAEESTTATVIELRVIWRADDPTGPKDAETTWECWLTDGEIEDDAPTGYIVTPITISAAYNPDGAA